MQKHMEALFVPLGVFQLAYTIPYHRPNLLICIDLNYLRSTLKLFFLRSSDSNVVNVQVVVQIMRRSAFGGYGPTYFVLENVTSNCYYNVLQMDVIEWTECLLL